MPRTFFAVDLDAAARRAAARCGRALASRLAGVRWIRPESYHVTLRFLGNVEPEAIPQLAARVGEALARCAPFELSLGAPALFPHPRRPRVVALALEPERPLRSLAAAVEGAVVAAGLAPEERRFRAHLTLGRVGAHRVAPLEIAEPLGAVFPVHEAVLYESQLRHTGARYIPLERLPLGAEVSPDPETSKGEDHGEG